VLVRTYLYENFKVKQLLQMEDISKNKDLRSTEKWFIFSKVNKFETLRF